jgi:hypothetical protein
MCRRSMDPLVVADESPMYNFGPTFYALNFASNLPELTHLQRLHLTCDAEVQLSPVRKCKNTFICFALRKCGEALGIQ